MASKVKEVEGWLGETGDAAKIMGVSTTYIRYLSDVGTLPTFAITPSGRRIYELDKVEQLRAERLCDDTTN